MSIAYESEYAQVPETDRKKVWPAARKKLVQKYGWGIPTDEVISRLTAASIDQPLFEVGAGNGYIAHVVQTNGGNIIPVDIYPPEQVWTTVYELCFTELTKEYVQSLLLVWPPAHSSVAADCIEELEPERLFFIGHPHSHITGDEAFHTHLTDFSCSFEVELPSWGDNTTRAVFQEFECS